MSWCPGTFQALVGQTLCAMVCLKTDPFLCILRAILSWPLFRRKLWVDPAMETFRFLSSSDITQSQTCQQLHGRFSGASLPSLSSPMFLNRSLIGMQPENITVSDDPGSSQSQYSSQTITRIINRIVDRLISAIGPIIPLPATSPLTPVEVCRHHFSAISQISVSHEHFPGNISKVPSVQQFTEHTIRWLQHANTAYAERKSVMATHYPPTEDFDVWTSSVEVTKKKLGIFYPKDYQTHELPLLTDTSYLGLHSLPEYFDGTYIYSFVTTDNVHSPSECLSAFFHGPTVADCATTLLACQYRAIETIIGTDEFNKIFAAPASKFRIARSLFVSAISPETPLPAECENLQPIDLVNPLHSLFDDVRYSSPLTPDSNPIERNLSEADIKEGDILYIAGVDRYTKKHHSGDDMGFNLICTGQNSSGRNLYLGFCPDLFVQPKTYDEVKKMLIDGYNEPQNSETIAAIEPGVSGYAELTNDTVPDDHPIVGITAVLRYSPLRWEHLALQRDKAWHRQPLMPASQALAAVPLENGSPFPVEHFDSDFDSFESLSPQQELMKITALKFTHAVIDGTVEPSHKKPMGLFLSGLAGIGKTHLCVAVAKKAAEHGVKTLYIDEATVGGLLNKLHGNLEQWYCDINNMIADKDLVVLDEVNSETGCAQMFLAETMQRVTTDNIAVMVSSNNHIPVRYSTPDFLDPLDKRAHNFLSLSDLQGDSCRSQWWLSPEVQAGDKLSRLGQYEGNKAAAVITEQPVSLVDIARALNISADQIRRVGAPMLPGEKMFSSDYDCRDLSKTQHQAVVLEFIKSGNKSVGYFEISQFINIIQRVHDEGLKLIVKTNNSKLFTKEILEFLNTDFLIQGERVRIIDRLNHLFHEFFIY